MRGTLLLVGVLLTETRIIPADAGNTVSMGENFYLHQDHPRGCGEHQFDALKVEPRMGSSPRMRGTQGRVHTICRYAGIIPADAGNTVDIDYRVRVYEDHPRGCGEHPWPDS